MNPQPARSTHLHPARRRALVGGLVATLIIIGQALVVTTADASTPSVLVSTRSDRTKSRALNQATVAGRVHVFVKHTGKATVSFTLDRKRVYTDKKAPFDLRGTAKSGAAVAFDTRTVGDGKHTLTVVVQEPRSTKTKKTPKPKTSSATFVVRNVVDKVASAPVTPTATATPTAAPTTTAPTAPAVAPSAEPSPSTDPTPTPEPTGSTEPVPTIEPTPTAPVLGSDDTGVPPAAAPAGTSWNLAFGEEFSATSYDRSKLTPCFDWNYGDCTKTFNNGREYYDPAQVRVSDGTAKLVAEPVTKTKSGCGVNVCTYKSGLLSTARPLATKPNYLYTFTYGYVEARLQLPAEQGFFGAFWMLPANPQYKYDAEIDILENLGAGDTVAYQTYHYGGRKQHFALTARNSACAPTTYSDGMHRFGVDWQPDHIAYYVDGVKCGELRDAAKITKLPMQIILNLMVDNDWQRSANLGLVDASASDQLVVDYLRVYQSR